ncbi:hypothetical protein B0G81_5901 [Paraburkholderia sp. BL6665CI2N2]|nr:hypothetical protein B0G81_5901 [Paraburkholderia sp. BL6665CI2N2]
MHGLCTLLRNLAVSDEAASQNLVLNIRSRVNPQKRSYSSAMFWEFEKHHAARDATLSLSSCSRAGFRCSINSSPGHAITTA